MPVLPTNMFIVRNVKLTGAWTQEDKDFYRDKVCASLGGGWGLFCAHGNYSQDTTESTYTGSFQNASLVIQQPQLIALAGILLNHCPAPDAHLKWGPDANLSPAHYPLALEERQAMVRHHAFERYARRVRELHLKKAEEEIAERRSKWRLGD